MKLRKARLSDASSIAAISIEVWLGTYIKKGVNAFFADYALQTFTDQKMQNLMTSPTEHFTVSENEQGIDGFVRVSVGSKAPVPDCDSYEISTLYVQPRHHGKGIGKRLLNAATTCARQRGARSIWLATNAENDLAIAFYLAQGFSQVGETQFRIDDQAYLNNVYRLNFD
ncbi:GNAT family N-acetyltransferase [Yoonia sp. BS5-3]|uniref:N-acetyltransferase family protein n=1 Tax=Yoonia phaeophyticola TaxID=3137369 RepID=A0ABZ2V3L8_9RHOB